PAPAPFPYTTLFRSRLAAAELAGGFGIDEVVDTGGAAAEVRLGDLRNVQAGDGAQELAGLGSHALSVRQVAGVVVGDRHRQRMARSRGTELDEHLADVADLLGEGARPVGVLRVVGE